MNKKAIIKPKNIDYECFKWCITRAMNPVSTHAEHMSLKAIDKFKKQNEDRSINVFRFEGSRKYIHPLRAPKDGTMKQKFIDFLLISDGRNHHYCIMKDLEKLLFSQISKYKGRKYFC